MELSWAVVIPVYNNDSAVGTVIDQVRNYADTVIVVNDGSTDGTSTVLAGRSDITVLVHDINRGKGEALKTGFDYAAKQGFTHVITLDADGQHRPNEIPLFLNAMRDDPEAIWIGARTVQGSGQAPLPNRLGRWFSNMWIRFFTGFSLSDTQSGFRIYPLAHIEPLELKTSRYDYEQEVLLETAWAGVPLKEFPIEQIYFPRDQRVSHFHPIRDLLRIVKVHLRAMARHLNPFKSIQVEGKTAGEKVRNLIRQELTSHTTPNRAALAFSLGVFFGVFPIHGFQVVALMVVATKLNLNRPIAFLGVNVSSLPLLPFLIIAAVYIGDLFLPGTIRAAEMTGSAIQKGGAGFLAFMLGSVILAPLAAIASYPVSYVLFKTIKKAKQPNFGE